MKHSYLGGRSDGAPRPAADLPDNLILFDGICVLCSFWIRVVVRRDAARRFRFVTLQSPGGRALAAQLGIDRDNPDTNAAIVDGIAYLKSDAALKVMKHLRGMRWSGILSLVPKRIRDWLYDRIARNRYAVFGRHATCPLPSAEIAGRFLDHRPPADLS